MNFRGIDIKTLRPAKIHHEVKDPVRYPKVVNGYEDQMKEIYRDLQQDMFVEVVKKMVEIQVKK